MPLMTAEALASLDPEWLQVAINSPYREAIINMVREPLPHIVHYSGSAVTPRHVYTRPDQFYWDNLAKWERGPSDCTWIVPGTGQ